jgi:predicted transcriptional regulator
MSDTGILTLNLSPELKERLGSLAEKTKRTPSFLVGEAIADYVDRELRIREGRIEPALHPRLCAYRR